MLLLDNQFAHPKSDRPGFCSTSLSRIMDFKQNKLWFMPCSKLKCCTLVVHLCYLKQWFRLVLAIINGMKYFNLISFRIMKVTWGKVIHNPNEAWLLEMWLLHAKTNGSWWNELYWTAIIHLGTAAIELLNSIIITIRGMWMCIIGWLEMCMKVWPWYTEVLKSTCSDHNRGWWKQLLMSVGGQGTWAVTKFSVDLG